MRKTRLINQWLTAMLSLSMVLGPYTPGGLGAFAETDNISVTDGIEEYRQPIATPFNAGKNEEESTSSDALYDEDGFLLDGDIFDDGLATHSNAVIEDTIPLGLFRGPLLEATAVQNIQLNQTVDSFLSKGNPVSRFKIDPGANSLVDIEIEGNVNPVIEVLKGDSLLARRDYTSLRLSMSGDETYFINVCADENYDDPYGEFQITVSLILDLSDRTFIGGGKSRTQAQTVNVDSEYIIETPLSDCDNLGERWYMFTLDYSQVIDLEYDSDSGNFSDYVIELYYDDILLKKDIGRRYLRGGVDYYIRILAGSSEDDNYGTAEFKLKKVDDLYDSEFIEGGTTKNTAAEIEIGEEYLSIRPLADADNPRDYWFKFTSPINIHTVIITEADADWPYCYVYRNDQLLRKGDLERSITLREGEDYYFCFSPKEAEEYGTFTFKLEEYEYGDYGLENSLVLDGGKSREQAPEIIMDQVYISELPQADEANLAERWYKIQPEASVKAESAFIGDMNYFDPPTINLWRGEHLIRTMQLSCGGRIDSVVLSFAKGETYYLEIRANNEATYEKDEMGYGTFFFCIDTVDDISDHVFKEGGSSRTNAVPIKLGEKYLSELPVEEKDTTAADWYQFVSDSDQEVDVILEEDMSWTPDMILFEENKVKGTRSGKYTVNTGKTYYLKVAAGGNGKDSYGGYRFNLKLPEVPVTGVIPDKASNTVMASDSFTLTATIVPENATNKNVTWSSSNNAVATVDQTGKVKAVKAGTADITVTTEDGGYTAVCRVTVTQPVTGVTLSRTTNEVTEGDSFTLTANVVPADATNKKVAWSSSDTKVATVDQNGKVTAVKAGIARITVKTEDGAKTSYCNVSVKAKDLKSAFIERLYRTCLNREADAGGLNYWLGLVNSGSLKGISLAGKFVFSPEFTGKNYCDEHFVKQLYVALMDREADAGGLGYWTGRLANGEPRERIMNDFTSSVEYKKMCSDAGIALGARIKEPKYGTKPYGACAVCGEKTKVVQFVERTYKECMGRAADEGGLKYWSKGLYEHTKTGKSLVTSFVLSTEMKNKKLSSKDYISAVYRVMLGREADQGGLNYWQGLMKKGKTIEDVINGFVDSKEFTRICNDYGIQRK